MHIHDIRGCDEPGVSSKLRAHLVRRFGNFKAQEKSRMYVVMEVSRAMDLPVQLIFGNFAKAP